MYLKVDHGHMFRFGSGLNGFHLSICQSQYPLILSSMANTIISVSPGGGQTPSFLFKEDQPSISTVKCCRCRVDLCLCLCVDMHIYISRWYIFVMLHWYRPTFSCNDIEHICGTSILFFPYQQLPVLVSVGLVQTLEPHVITMLLLVI